MIIIGDIASPDIENTNDLKRIFIDNKSVFQNHSLICNLEGLICDDRELSDNKPILFNHSSVIEALKIVNTKAVSLANNHTLDLPQYLDNTIKCLTESSINFSGAGKTPTNVSKPVNFKDGEKEIVLFNFCWDFLLYNQRNPTENVYVAEINYEELISNVKEYKKLYSEASIIVFLHWSFDLETLPFPMYRQFSRALIDSGVNLVVGCHSHCVQGAEKYKDGYIVYGLGNFFVPYNKFANGKITYPDFCRIELAFEWNSSDNSAKCHWFEYQNSHKTQTLAYIKSEDFENSQLLKKYSPYVQLSDEEYLSYFKTHRRKKILVPIFLDYRSKFRNSIKTFFLKSRARFARMLSILRLRNWNN